MSNGSDAVIAAARSQLGLVVKNDNQCAQFVSDVYKAAGLAWAFIPSSSVSAIAMQFSGAKSSTDLSKAQPGDLLVFGTNEHIGIYSGGGMVINTSIDLSTNVTKVVECKVTDVRTGPGKPPTHVFSKVLFTHLYLDGVQTDPVAGVETLVGNAPGVLFGSLFGWVPVVASNGAVLVLVLVLAVMGVRQVVDSSG